MVYQFPIYQFAETTRSLYDTHARGPTGPLDSPCRRSRRVSARGYTGSYSTPRRYSAASRPADLLKISGSVQNLWSGLNRSLVYVSLHHIFDMFCIGPGFGVPPAAGDSPEG